MSTTNETRLDVTGMTCGGCVSHVTKALGKVPGVTSAEVSLEGRSAVVRHDGTPSPESLVAAVEKAGYGATVAA